GRADERGVKRVEGNIGDVAELRVAADGIDRGDHIGAGDGLPLPALNAEPRDDDSQPAAALTGGGPARSARGAPPCRSYSARRSALPEDCPRLRTRGRLRTNRGWRRRRPSRQ